MNISELIKKLEAIKEEHGDLAVEHTYEDGRDFASSDRVYLDTSWTHEGARIESSVSDGPEELLEMCELTPEECTKVAVFVMNS